MTERFDEAHHPNRRKEDHQRRPVHIHCQTYINVDVGGIHEVEQLILQGGANDTDRPNLRGGETQTQGTNSAPD